MKTGKVSVFVYLRLVVRLGSQMVTYLLGQRKDRGSNPGSAIFLQYASYRINFLGGHGPI